MGGHGLWTRHVGLTPDTHEPEIVAYLFKLYADKMKWCG